MSAHAQRRHISPVLPAAIGLAWAVSLAAELGGVSALVHHDGLFEGGLPVGAALALFLLAWQLMVAAMMLPSSLPLVRLFSALARGQRRPGLAQAALLGGYALVWGLFGVVALAGDLVVHRAVESASALAERPYIVPAGALLLAGGFQFSKLKDRCLDECRHPAAFVLPRYRHGSGEAFRLGAAHGLFCLGCCWALMLLMFAAGVASLVWMAGLAAVMVYEKVGRHGRRLVPVVGVTLLVWGGLVLAQPGWLPPWLAWAPESHLGSHG